ncbi:MAG TPA: hypothetical protein VEQ59_04520, partial [Polyangiaceae bacterium]|nr:hypothetical protein [Polyangiaceae bacterium]
MRSPRVPRGRRSPTLILALLGASGAWGCRASGSAVAESSPAASASAVISTAVPERAEAVARADAWAVAGTKQGGRAGAKVLLDAARLRERIFRADHREADALEAIELYRQAARSEPSLRCSAATSAAVLEGELKADPELTYQALYRAGLLPGSEETCKQRAAEILSTLSAYRPLPTVLTQIDREHSASSPPSSSSTPSSPSRTDERPSERATEPAPNEGVV